MPASYRPIEVSAIYYDASTQPYERTVKQTAACMWPGLIRGTPVQVPLRCCQRLLLPQKRFAPKRLVKTIRREYSVGSSSEVTSVNSPFRGDAARVFFYLVFVSFASLFSGSSSLALFSFSNASNRADI